MSAVVEHTVLPTDETGDAAALQLLAAMLSSDTPVTLSTEGGHESGPIPESVREVLRQAVAALVDHKAVTVSEQNTVLTTQEAAELLGVSRPTLVRLLESNAIPFSKPNRHRRVLLEDLLAYQRRAAQERRATLDEMTDDAEDGDLYRNVNGFVETR